LILFFDMTRSINNKQDPDLIQSFRKTNIRMYQSEIKLWSCSSHFSQISAIRHSRLFWPT